MSLVYLNGQYMSSEEATISPLDRGFLFGDSIYEVVPIFDGKALASAEHYQRLTRSLNNINFTNPLSEDDWQTIIEKLSDSREDNSFMVYVQITRGAQAGRAHHIPENITPTIFATTFDFPPRVWEEKGLSAITYEDTRWLGCTTKTTNLLPNVLAKSEAKNQNAHDAIFVRDGYALEGTSTNLFVITEGKIITPPVNENILPGITRQLTIKAINQCGIPLEETKIPLKALENADEIWLTSSTQDIIPVTQLNNRPVGDGKIGKVWRRVNNAFQTDKETDKDDKQSRKHFDISMRISD
ncbi:MAG: D-amino acid aminotransferase [Gammaproteobacteria bacterium]